MKRAVQLSIAALVLSVFTTLFAANSAGAQTYTLTTLATFNSGNGELPYGGLILSGGTLYGTTYYGGDLSLNNGYGDGVGTVFALTPGATTTTTIEASPNPSTYGAAVTIVATTSPKVPNGETVTFLQVQFDTEGLETFLANARGVGRIGMRVTD